MKDCEVTGHVTSRRNNTADEQGHGMPREQKDGARMPEARGGLETVA